LALGWLPAPPTTILPVSGRTRSRVPRSATRRSGRRGSARMRRMKLGDRTAW